MRRFLPLALLAVMLGAGCADGPTPVFHAAQSSPGSTPGPTGAATPSAPAALSAAERLQAALVTDDELKADAVFAVADFERTFDQDHQVNYAYGVVPACGEKAASSTTEGRAVVAWSRAWWTGHGIAGQDAYVLPKQTAATVLAKVKSNLAGCGSFSEDDVTYHKTAKHQVKLPAGFTGSVAACFEGSGDTACFAYLGRGHVVTRLFSSAEDQAGAQRQLQALMAPVAARLQRLPA